MWTLVFDHIRDGVPYRNGDWIESHRQFASRLPALLSGARISYQIINPGEVLSKPAFYVIELSGYGPDGRGDRTFYIPETTVEWIKQNPITVVIWHPEEHAEWNYLDTFNGIKELGLARQTIFLSGNLEEQALEMDREGFYQRRFSLPVFEQIVRNMVKVEDTTDRPVRSKRFITLNNILRPHRLIWLDLLTRYDLVRFGHVSALNGKRTRSTILMELDAYATAYGDRWKDHERVVNTLDMIIEQQHLVLDRSSLHDPWHFAAVFEKLRPFHEEAWFSVVTETFCTTDSVVCLTEKTFLPIAYGLPFMIMGAPGSLRALRRLGYETFPELFNESYDDEINPFKRIRLIFEETRRLVCMSEADFLQRWESVQPKVQHNMSLLAGPTVPRRLSTLFRDYQ